MTTYYSDIITAGVPPKAGIGLQVSYATFEAATALALNDVIQMVPMAIGQTVVDMILSVDDLDSGSALVLDVGDGADTDRFIDGSTIGQAGGSAILGSGVAAATTPNFFNYEYTADDTIDILIAVGPAGGGTGTLKLTVFHTGAQR